MTFVVWVIEWMIGDEAFNDNDRLDILTRLLPHVTPRMKEEIQDTPTKIIVTTKKRRNSTA
ncbi:MAG: hypothetical protein AAGC47_15310 [Bacteroidota bacterium]